MTKPFDIKYVLSKYEHSLNGIDYVYYPAENCKRLVVVFSGIGNGEYNRISWYWSENEKWNETSYLFLRDLQNSFYVGTGSKELVSSYMKIISNSIEKCNIENNKVFCVGGSMGGYAAIYYALQCNLRCAIAVHPQINYRSTRLHKFLQWERLIRNASEFFYDLNDLLLKKNDANPFIYLEYGDYIADKEGAIDFIESFKRVSKGQLILVKHNELDHKTISPSKNKINSIISFIESFDI